MRKRNFRNLVFVPLFVGVILSNAQTKDSVRAPLADSLSVKPKAPEIKYPQIQFKGLFQSRYTLGMTKDVDVNGLHHSDHSGTDNGFLIKYMRAQAQVQISKRTEVVVLANLADFKNDPKGGVLENAYIKYTLNPKIAVTVGQFRPWFGIEETYPIDIIRSLDWSNQYSQFGKLGWTSFQIGVSVGGQVKLGKLPLQYAVSVVNGNGKNQINDNDNGKQYSTRLVLGLSPKYNLNLGLNGGVGEVFSKKVYAVGVDVTGNVKLNSLLSLDIQLEAKQATNHVLYNSLAENVRTSNPDDYLVRGIYFLPNLRYEVNYHNLNAIDLSVRYEYLDSNFRLNSNPRQTITPMIALEFLKNYGARIQLGLQMDRYKKQMENTNQYNSNLFIVQVQGRF
ncbi:OprO/OprP family phosphate-selective porin [Chryseobacterium oryctis]|uniref:OprO/OprP family phosphate-selective porin n=1 Tax=Chryseobacterium oryctis TaxID=2952618 RepID=A0ABT3HJC9_9FLAO|nr:OprO/OprP family phosphate-selective porin [Chryseobacterium oryctis]MCW3159818.1 OprO/OprP family phosphate-selective porin [Chryseobacterium oryctis]